MTACAQNSPMTSCLTQNKSQNLYKALPASVLPSSLLIVWSHLLSRSSSLSCFYIRLLAVLRTCRYFAASEPLHLLPLPGSVFPPDMHYIKCPSPTLSYFPTPSQPDTPRLPFSPWQSFSTWHYYTFTCLLTYDFSPPTNKNASQGWIMLFFFTAVSLPIACLAHWEHSINIWWMNDYLNIYMSKVGQP